MDRDESIALFKRCEKARGEALAAGKTNNEAHEAAKVIWNGWVEKLIAELKQLEDAGDWDAETDHEGNLAGKNHQTADWLKYAAVNFSRCHFVAKGAKDAAVGPIEASSSAEETVNSISLAGYEFDVRGFKFLGFVDFEGASFSARVFFTNASFCGRANFVGASFSYVTSIRECQLFQPRRFRECELFR